MTITKSSTTTKSRSSTSKPQWLSLWAIHISRHTNSTKLPTAGLLDYFDWAHRSLRRSWSRRNSYANLLTFQYDRAGSYIPDQFPNQEVATSKRETWVHGWEEVTLVLCFLWAFSEVFTVGTVLLWLFTLILTFECREGIRVPSSIISSQLTHLSLKCEVWLLIHSFVGLFTISDLSSLLHISAPLSLYIVPSFLPYSTSQQSIAPSSYFCTK